MAMAVNRIAVLKRSQATANATIAKLATAAATPDTPTTPITEPVAALPALRRPITTLL